MNYTKTNAFLGGTCGQSTWREEVEAKLVSGTAFNPVVEDWTEDCMTEEKWHRESDDLVIYWITSEMTGVYSIAEVVDDSNKRPEKVVFGFDTAGFDSHQIKSLNQVSEIVKMNGGAIVYSTKRIAQLINTMAVYKMFVEAGAWDTITNHGTYIKTINGVDNMGHSGVVRKDSKTDVDGVIVEQTSYIMEGQYPDGSYPLNGITVFKEFDAQESINDTMSGKITLTSAEEALCDFEAWLEDVDEYMLDQEDYDAVGVTYAKLVFEQYHAERESR